MLQQMFEATAKIRSSSLKPMFTWRRRLVLPGNAAHIYTVAAHARQVPIELNK